MENALSEVLVKERYNFVGSTLYDKNNIIIIYVYSYTTYREKGGAWHPGERDVGLVR